MPIDIHGLARRYESMPALDLPSVRESVKEFRASLQGRKKEFLKPFGLDDLDKFKDNPAGFVKMVGYAVDSFKEKKEQDAPYRKLYEDERCLVTFTSKAEGAASAGSHLKIDGDVKCPWCICVKHPDNERWWTQYKAAALAFIYAKYDACCVLLTARDALDTMKGRFAFSQVEGIENQGLKDNPEEQRKVLDRLYRKTGLSDSRLAELLRPALESIRGRVEKIGLNESLLDAVGDRCPERVKECLDLGADVDTLSEYDWTPLFFAANMGKFEIVKLLIDAGANVNALDRFEDTPLHTAANWGSLEICKLLLDAGVVVDAVNRNCHTSLFLAASKGYLEIVKLLIDAGADVNARTLTGNSVLNEAVLREHHETCKLLLEAGAEVDSRDKNGWTPLLSAVLEGNIETVKLLLDFGARVDVREKNGWTPLHLAARRGLLEICKSLIESGADVNSRNNDENTPLHEAALNGSHETCKLLLDAGARVDAREKNEWTALHLATVRTNHEECSFSPCDKGD